MKLTSSIGLMYLLAGRDLKFFTPSLLMTLLYFLELILGNTKPLLTLWIALEITFVKGSTTPSLKSCFPATSLNRMSFSLHLNIKAKNEFGKFLGFPIFHQKPQDKNFQFILDRLNSKLGGWKIKFLNMIGKTTLVKASFNNISTHIMQHISIP